MIKGTQRRRRNTRLPNKNSPLPINSVGILSVTATGMTEVTITFSQPVKIGPSPSLPAWKFGTDGATINAIVSGNNTAAIVFTLGSNISTGQPYQMLNPDPAARGSTGLPIQTSIGALA